jgi:hypothetical protein
MKRSLIYAVRAAMVCAAVLVASSASAQGGQGGQGGQQSDRYTSSDRYTRPVRRGYGLKIDWLPSQETPRRYTVSVSPLRLVSNGIKFDFERELPGGGHWFGTSLQVHFAPPASESDFYYWDTDGNDHVWGNSGWDDYHRMWGLGTSAMYKRTFAHRGWYFSTGLVFDFFRVGVMTNDYLPYHEDGLEFYDYGERRDTKSYFKPMVQINIGKHMALSERVYFDLYAGVGYSHAFYKRDNLHLNRRGYTAHHDRMFTEMSGFAYRGLQPTGGFRVGILLFGRDADL